MVDTSDTMVMAEIAAIDMTLNLATILRVSIGKGAMTGSGSVITSDVGSDALALARAPQVEKPGMAKKLFDILKAKKAKIQRDR